jgi:hypothetical protein
MAGAAHRICSVDAVKKAEMDGAYGRRGEEEKCIQGFSGES